MEKLYRDRDWLWEHYIVREESMVAMAKEARCSDVTIRNWLLKMDVPIHVNGGVWRDENWLYEQYIIQGKSTSVMAKEAGCNLQTIINQLRRNNIPIRSCSEGLFLATRNSVIVMPDFLEFLRGEILGDGYVGITSNYSARYSHSSKYEKYLIWLSESYDAWGIKQSGRIRRRKDKQTGAISYQYTSRSYPELVPIYKRWYPGGKKTVPEDLKLTPIMARQWYLGDGGLAPHKLYRPNIKFNTQGFDKESVEYLVKELNNLGFKATCRPADNTIGLSVHSVKDFLKWIGPCPISCYDYKWDYGKK